MKKMILGLAVAGLMCSCQKEQQGYEIKGSLKGNVPDSSTVILQKRDTTGIYQPIDTSFIVGNSFLFEGRVEEMDLYTLRFASGRNMAAPIIVENTSLTFSAPIDSLNYMKVRGSEQNEWLMEYIDHSRKINEIGRSFRQDLRRAYEEQDSVAYAALIEESEELVQKNLDFVKTYIREHPASLMSLTIMSDMAQRKTLPALELDSLYQGLDQTLKDRREAKKLKEIIDKNKATSIGATAPDFRGPNPDGQELALSGLRGKVTLVDFWAAWCKPCRMENPNIKQVYEKYKDQGFTVVGVSLDRRAEDWTAAIEQDGLVWNHVSNLMHWQDPIAVLYGVSAIPAAFLLDENGKIVGKDLRGPELENAVAALLD